MALMQLGHLPTLLFEDKGVIYKVRVFLKFCSFCPRVHPDNIGLNLLVSLWLSEKHEGELKSMNGRQKSR